MLLTILLNRLYFPLGVIDTVSSETMIKYVRKGMYVYMDASSKFHCKFMMYLKLWPNEALLTQNNAISLCLTHTRDR